MSIVSKSMTSTCRKPLRLRSLSSSQPMPPPLVKGTQLRLRIRIERINEQGDSLDADQSARHFDPDKEQKAPQESGRHLNHSVATFRQRWCSEIFQINDFTNDLPNQQDLGCLDLVQHLFANSCFNSC